MQENKITKFLREHPRSILIVIILLFVLITIISVIIYNVTKEDQIGDSRRETNIIIDRNLPYSDYVSGNEFTVHRNLYPKNPNDSYIQIDINACGDQNIANQAKNKVIEWLKNIGVNPNTYQIIIPDLCDGEAS